MHNYIVVGKHPWNKALFDNHLKTLPGNWYYCDSTEQYMLGAKLYPPRYIFFLHWSEIVPDYFVEKYECVCFHPTDLPYGRGGTPFQNLIKKGHKNTVVSAFKMTDDLDAGPVYDKEGLSLAGRMEEIFLREMEVISQMIFYITTMEPVPEAQVGEPEYFTRLTPDMSEISPRSSFTQLYDHIRMLDAPGYPPATLTLDNLVIEFVGGDIEGNTLVGKFIVREKK